MSSVTKSFTAAGASELLSVEPGQSVSYSVSGTFTGKVRLERSSSPTAFFEDFVVGDDDAGFSGVAINTTPAAQWFRFRASTLDSGTADCSVEDVAQNTTTLEDGMLVVGAEPVTTAGLGAKSGATVDVSENGDGIVHRTTLTLNSTPITLTDDAGQGQYGAVKVYDFPAGNILVLGAVVDASLILVGAQWADTAQGDVGLGTTAVDNGDALATTEQNVIATTPIAAMVAQAGPIDCQSAAAGIPLAKAGDTDSDLYLNVRIDDDAAHTTQAGNLLSGQITLVWINLGDF